MNNLIYSFILFVLCFVTGLAAYAQSSSLYIVQDNSAPADSIANSTTDASYALSPAVSRVSLAAVRLPEPRAFSIHDLITIIVRESTTSDSESSLDTEKKTKLTGKISAFPNLQLRDLLNFQLRPSDMDEGQPAVDIISSTKFEGDGEYERKDTFITRITARIIDIKPNGTLVLEARKFIQSDKESLSMLLTGTCRKQDVTVDNTILSTQIYDLNLVKNHQGELRSASKKGVLTKFFEILFNF